MPQTLKFSTPAENGAGSDVAEAEAARLNEAHQDEANMRRALGMLGGAPRQSHAGAPQAQNAARDRRPAPQAALSAPRRHRFVQDGDVPVTLMRPRAEHHEAPAPSGTSPVNRLESLQASFATEHAARERAERALEEAQATIRDLRTKLAHMELAREEALAPRPPATPEPAPEAVIRTPRVPKRVMTPRQPRMAKEPEPVKWWVKPRAKRATTAE